MRLSALLLLIPGLLFAGPPRVLMWDAEIAARPLALVRGKEVIELKGLHPSKRSEPIRLKGEGPLMLRALDRGTEEKPWQERPCVLPEGVTRPLILLMSDEEEPTGVRIVVFEDDPGGFGWGTYRFLNATPRALAIRIENQSARIPIGWKPIDLRITGEPRGMGVMFADLDDLNRPLYSAVWEHDPDTRTLCFVVPGSDPRTGPVQIKAVPQERLTYELDQE